MSTYVNTVHVQDHEDCVHRIDVTVNAGSATYTVDSEDVVYREIVISVPPNTTGSIPVGSIQYSIYNIGSSTTPPIDDSTLQSYTLDGFTIPAYMLVYESTKLNGRGIYGAVSYNSGQNNLLIKYTTKVV